MNALRTNRPAREARAFTLIELIAVIMVMGLVGAIVLPSAMALFAAGAVDQARNVLAGQLAAARALAIQDGTYYGVHVQMADEDATGLSNACFSAIISVDPAHPGFFFKLAARSKKRESS